MEAPAAEVLLDRIRGLPGAPPLLDAVAEQAGVYLVGGAVRDLLLGVGSPDLDLVVDGDTAPVVGRLGGELRVHDRFGTATVVLAGHTYDFARARRERYTVPGALPEVEPAPIAEDLERRDFTVNAIAVELGGPRAGELRAAPGAQADLGARRLRVMHVQSFIDDPTRLLRLARYASRFAGLGFAIEPRTAALAEAAIAGGALATVSGPRIGGELRLLAREEDPVAALGLLGWLGIDGAIAPGFGLRDADLASRALALLPAAGRRDRLALALAARELPAGHVELLLDRLGFEAGDRDTITAAAVRAPSVAEALTAAGRPSEIADAATGAADELVALAGALGPAEAARAWLDELSSVRLEIDGGDLLAAGVPEGPAIGRGLRAALHAKLDGLAGDREAELTQALTAARDAVS
jgi:tRNA nucleotidyltransferase (CCA-adding enzyme)